MIYLLNIFIYLLTPLGGILSYCSLLRIAFDAIFGALLFLQCLFSLHMFLFMLPWIFSLRNSSLWHFRVPNVSCITADAISLGVPLLKLLGLPIPF
jgi:hypothetical protein